MPVVVFHTGMKAASSDIWSPLHFISNFAKKKQIPTTSDSIRCSIVGCFEYKYLIIISRPYIIGSLITKIICGTVIKSSGCSLDSESQQIRRAWRATSYFQASETAYKLLQTYALTSWADTFKKQVKHIFNHEISAVTCPFSSTFFNTITFIWKSGTLCRHFIRFEIDWKEKWSPFLSLLINTLIWAPSKQIIATNIIVLFLGLLKL